MGSTSRWLSHTGMTDPAEFGGRIAALPEDVATLARAVQGLLLHRDALALYGLDARASEPFDRSTLPVRERLGRLAARGPLALSEGRAPARREVGTCRDFALLLTAFLRSHGVPARCRCGFASYLGPGWEDHWVCEYWNDGREAWCLADAQLDEVLSRACAVAFDPLDMPREAFLPAGEAWSACRLGQFHPGLFGNGDTRGTWFMGVDVARDSLSLGGHETSPWDRWREATAEQRRFDGEALSRLDALARDPHARAPAPPWLDPSPPRQIPG